jgi:flagellar basal-body rod modification protein FlgD
MEVTAALGATQSTAIGAAADKAALTENFDDFLKLLTTQLQYQDPLEPMDSTEFVNQLTQFTQVEQSIKSNSQLEQLLALQSANQSVQAIGFIGRTIEAVGDTAPLGQNGIEFTYTLDGLAESSLLVVMDSDGQVITSSAGGTSPGKNSFAWDGLDSAGNRVADGNYRLAVAARDASNETLGVTTGVVSRVTGVETGENGLLLSLGTVLIPIDKVVSIRESIQQNTGV